MSAMASSRTCTSLQRSVCSPSRPFLAHCHQQRTTHRRHARTWLVRASADPQTDAPKRGAELENPDSEVSRKKAEADRLREAEKFMVIGSGEATCKGCGYEFKPEKGDPEFPVPKGTRFQDTPEDYICPVCGASKDKFEARVKVVAGFAENQQYGLGSNSMTGGQKQLLIYGSLLVLFALFLSGYALE